MNRLNWVHGLVNNWSQNSYLGSVSPIFLIQRHHFEQKKITGRNTFNTRNRNHQCLLKNYIKTNTFFSQMRITLPFFQNANRSRSTVSTRPRNESPITRIWNTSSCDSGLPLYSSSNSDCGDREYMRSAPTMSRSQYDGLRSRKYHFKTFLCACGQLGVPKGLKVMTLAQNARDWGLIPYWGTNFFLSFTTHCYIWYPITGFIDLLFVWSEVWGHACPKGVNVTATSWMS